MNERDFYNSQSLWWRIRAWLSEEFVVWSMRACPRGYVPSYIELIEQTRKRSA
jgi:hypothetical protein